MKDELKINWTQLIGWFNLTLRQYNSKIPCLAYLSKGKKAQVQRIVNEMGTKKVLVDAVVKMACSDFLNGKIRSSLCPSGFVASFPWLTENNERLIDVANGKYDNPPEQELTAADLRRMEAEKREEEQRRRREQARRIEEEEHERLERQRQEAQANAAKPEELQKIWAEIGLPPLRESEKSPRERIFSKSKH